MPHASKCTANCPCDQPRDWRSQNISLIRLEEVEIKNFRGGDHEIDFVTLLFGWAPLLKKIIIKLADEVKESKDWRLRHNYLQYMFGASFRELLRLSQLW